jgi:hypothetical protein
MVGATLLPASAFLMTQGKAQADERHEGKRRLTKGDADLLRFAAWAEVVESDLWTQYNELGGATQPNDGPKNVGNPAYILALQNLDGDMPQYITDNTDDELSHAAFLNAYLMSHGAEPVNLDQFRTLPSSKATGAFTADGLFGNIGQPNGQPQSFIDFAMQLAKAADNARRELEEE